MTSEVNEAQFAASSENQPVESCETSFTPPDNLERKLQREYNYHIHGSWMDKPGVAGVPHVVYTPEMREEERRRRVSHDPFAKMFSAPQQSELYPRAENTGSNTNPYFWPQSPATPARGSFDIFYGPNPKNLLPGNPEDLYEPQSAGTFSLSKTPVPESGTSLHSQTNINRYPKTADTDTGESPPPHNSWVPENTIFLLKMMWQRWFCSLCNTCLLLPAYLRDRFSVCLKCLQVAKTLQFWLRFAWFHWSQAVHFNWIISKPSVQQRSIRPNA